jgi:hypothetical protein
MDLAEQMRILDEIESLKRKLEAAGIPWRCKLAGEMLEKLDSGAGERQMLAWFKRHPEVIAQFVAADHPIVLREFPIVGVKGRRQPDFVVIDSYSAAWDIHLIEFEDPTALLFTDEGKPRRKLAEAIAQIDRWRTIIEQQRSHVLGTLGEWAKTRDLINGARNDELSDCNGLNLGNTTSTVCWWYRIVIGRRHLLRPEDAELRKQLRDRGIDVRTYDGMLDGLDWWDENRSNHSYKID